MKIDHLDKGQHLNHDTSNKSASNKDPDEFARVLRDTVGSSSSNSVLPIQSTQAIRPVDPAVGSDSVALAVRTTDAMLNTMQNYQQMLATATTSLRQMQPLINQMRLEASEMAATMEQLPSGHTVKSVMKETLIQVRQEIERFDQGVYV